MECSATFFAIFTGWEGKTGLARESTGWRGVKGDSAVSGFRLQYLLALRASLRLGSFFFGGGGKREKLFLWFKVELLFFFQVIRSTLGS